MREFIDELQVSGFHETEPEGMGPGHALFLNAAAIGDTRLSASALLERLLQVEADLGRQRPGIIAPRTIDLDLIFYGGEVINVDGLRVPHPRFRSRRFVLAPLAEIAPDWVDPVTGKTVLELLSALPMPARG